MASSVAQLVLCRVSRCSYVLLSWPRNVPTVSGHATLYRVVPPAASRAVSVRVASSRAQCDCAKIGPADPTLPCFPGPKHRWSHWFVALAVEHA